MQERTELARAMRLLFDCMDRAAAWRLFGALALASAGGLLAALAPVALKRLVDVAGPSLQRGTRLTSNPMVAAAVVYLLCIAATRLVTELRPLLANGAEQRLFSALRIRLFEHVLALPLAFHRDQQSGGVIHSLQQGISGYQILLVSVTSSFIPVLAESGTMLVVLHSLQQPALALIFAATAAAYLTVTLHLGAGLRTRVRQVVDASAAATGILADSLVNIEPVKCFGSEPQLVAQFARSTTTLTRAWGNMLRLRVVNGIALIAVFTLAMGASIPIAISALMQGTLSVGGFTLAALYMVQLVRPLDLLATASRDIAQALAFIRPLIDLLDEPREESEPPRRPSPHARRPARDTANASGMRTAVPLCIESSAPLHGQAALAPPRISLQGVTLAYGAGAPVLNDLTLDIAPGCSIGIVGASGSGKSSLIRILLRLLTPQRGSIQLDGWPIDDIPVAKLRSMIAVIPQDTVLFNLSAAANIAIGKADATAADIERAARAAEIHDIIAALPCGYDTLIGERGLKLSGGERQRIAIARAVLRDPLIYVLDEATSMLDAATEEAILYKLRSVSAGRTTISIAHRMSALKHADEIVVLVDGKVAEQGGHDALLARRGPYAKMWHEQRLSDGRAAAPA